jgi:predicted nicotinamide N-methyase
MIIPASIESFTFSGEQIELFVPSASFIQERYLLEKAAGNEPLFPYWAQVWPAAKALCEIIAAQPELVKDKNVLELAAGIGLPSLLAARFANDIVSSDYIQDALDVMQRSVIHNNLHNIQTALIDWNHLPVGIKPDVLLLSDINYDPSSFEILFAVLRRFIEQGATILLSTPQRIAGRAFMERMQPWCKQQREVEILHKGALQYTSVWVMRE